MIVSDTPLEGVKLISLRQFSDRRGSFCKYHRASIFKEYGLRSDFRECYYTKSIKGVIRGMHFQYPPYDHAKLVTIVSGEVLDVVVDLRRDSNSFGCAHSFHLSELRPNSIYIPSGFAHGFAALSDCTLLYDVTSEYMPNADAGILWNSFGFEWPILQPILSDRDADFPSFSEFDSVF